MGGSNAFEGGDSASDGGSTLASLVPLLNRTDALADLAALLEQASHGEGRTAFILGEAGSGKSALVRTMLERAGSDNVRIAITRAYEGDDAIPYSPWITLMRQLDDLQEAIAEPIGRHGSGAQDTGVLGRQIASVLTAAARRQPLVLVFEDIGNADESSLVLLRLVAQRVPESSILLIITLNTTGESTSAIESWMTLVARESQARQVVLRPVRPGAISTFVRTRYPEIGTDELERIVLDLERMSGGNALFLSELLALLGAHIPGGASLADRLHDLPISLSAAVDQRAARLSPRALQTLRLAAIAGNAIDVDLLALLRGCHPDEIVADLEEALSHGLLTDDPQGLRFRHGVFRQGLIDQQSHFRRRRHHAEIARILMSRPRARPAEIAFHAERAGELAAACAGYERAAVSALSAHALPEAIHCLRRALALAESADLSPARQDELRLALADSLKWTDFDAAEQEVARVLTRAQMRNDALTLARAHQGQAVLLYEAGEPNASLALLERVIPDLEAAGDTRSLASALTYAGYCYGSLSDFDELDRVADQLTNVASTLNDATLRATALAFKSTTLAARGEPDDAPALGRESVNIMAELGHVEVASAYAQVVLMRVDLLANLHRPAMVDSLVRQGEELERLGLERIGTPRASDVAEYAYFKFLRGDIDSIRRVLPDPETIRDAPLPQVSKDICHNIAAELAEIEDRIDDAERLLRYVAPSPTTGFGDHAYQQWLTAVWRTISILTRRNDIAAARRWLNVMEEALKTRPHVPGDLLLRISQARIATATGDIKAAETVLKDIQQRAEATHNMLALIESLQLLSSVLIQAGQLVQALDAASRAVLHAERCHLPYHLAVSRVIRGEALRASGAPTEIIAAELDAARATLEPMNARLVLSRLEGVGRSDTRRWPAGLTDREVDVLRLLTQGLSDQQIAERLFISRRTVTTHVGNMLGKTHSANRTELAMWAVRHQLASAEPDDEE